MIMGFTKPIEHSNLTTKEGDFMNPLYVGIDVSSKDNVIYLHITGAVFPQIAEWMFTVDPGSESLENNIAERKDPPRRFRDKARANNAYETTFRQALGASYRSATD